MQWFGSQPVILELVVDRNPRVKDIGNSQIHSLAILIFVAFMKGKIADSVKNAKGESQATIWDYVKMCIRNETIRFLKFDQENDRCVHEQFQEKMASLYFQRDLTEGAQAAEFQAQINQTNQEWNQFLTKIGQKRVEINLDRKSKRTKNPQNISSDITMLSQVAPHSCMIKVGMS